MSVNSVDYPYFIPSTVGSEFIQIKEEDGSLNYATNGSIKDAYVAYKELFAQYSDVHSKLIEQFNAILALWGKSVKYAGALDLEAIFDENVLINVRNYQAGQCREGANAYKFYLRKVIVLLNNIFEGVKKGNALLGTLGSTILKPENYGQIHSLITNLEITDKYVQDAIKEMTQYSVFKSVEQAYFKVYGDVTLRKDDSFEVAEIAYRAVGEGSLLNDADGFSGLRAIKTTKFYIAREIQSNFYKAGETDVLAERYDEDYCIETATADKEISRQESTIKVFDELTLLDKLKYIVLYYTKKDTEDTEPHYIFPEDANWGFPCEKPEAATGAAEDTNEIGALELFYLGYLVERDGIANALASFFEVKTSAIKAQITLWSYRVKAIKYYLNLLNRGLDLLNASQSKEKSDIPVAACNILRLLGPNVTRTLFYLKDENGNPLNLKDGKDNLLSNTPYIVLQWQADAPKDGEEPDKTHFTKSKNYILVQASEEGINDFIGLTNNLFEKDKDEEKIVKNSDISWMFKKEIGPGTDAYAEFFKYESIDGTNSNGYKLSKKLGLYVRQEGVDTCKNECSFNSSGPNLFLSFDSDAAEKKWLPKELETSRLKVDAVLRKPEKSDVPNLECDKKDNDIWSTFLPNWTSTYQTVIENNSTQLEYIEKTITSLRKKINTFDTAASNFRNKAYSIYNKIVNKIG